MSRVLITGGSSGLGRVAALRLAAAGHRVTAVVRSEKDAAALAAEAGNGLTPLIMDVALAESVAAGMQRLLAQDGVPDVLINNAGVPCLGSMEELRIEDLTAALEVNVLGVLRLCQAVAPGMRRRGRGQIVNVGSALGVAALPMYGGYCATKFALEAMSEALRYELAPFGVTVNLLQPGLIDTPFANKKTAQSKLRIPEDSPYAGRLDSPAYAGLAACISTAEQVGDVLLRMLETPDAAFRWVCGQDSENWLAARRALDDAAFEAYVTQDGYGAPRPKTAD